MIAFKDLFQEYEGLAARADRAFAEVKSEYGPFVKCDVRCSDCCHSVFGLFLIESVYLNYHFNKLERKRRRECLLRGDKADRSLKEIEEKLRTYDHDPAMKALAIARERVRCPLLSGEQKCVLYPYRPITCRVYGIPAVVNGKVRACWKAGFEKGRSYPAFNLDGAYRELYLLSRDLLARAGQKNLEKASLLLSVSRSIKTPLGELISGG